MKEAHEDLEIPGLPPKLANELKEDKEDIKEADRKKYIRLEKLWENRELSYKDVKAIHGIESDEGWETDEDTHLKDFHDDDFRPYNPDEDDFDESVDSDDFYESVDSDDQLAMHEKHDDKFRPNKDRFDIEGSSQDLEETAKEVDKKHWR